MNFIIITKTIKPIGCTIIPRSVVLIVWTRSDLFMICCLVNLVTNCKESSTITLTHKKIIGPSAANPLCDYTVPFLTLAQGEADTRIDTVAANHCKGGKCEKGACKPVGVKRTYDISTTKETISGEEKCILVIKVTYEFKCECSGKAAQQVSLDDLNIIQDDGKITLQYKEDLPMAYYSVKNNILYVKPEAREELGKFLNAKIENNVWEFNISKSQGCNCSKSQPDNKPSESNEIICAKEKNMVLWNPKIPATSKDFKVYTKECIDQTVEVKCAVWQQNPAEWYSFSVTYGKCKGEPQYFCFETFGKVGEGKIYSDDKCKCELRNIDVFGWFCLQI